LIFKKKFHEKSKKMKIGIVYFSATGNTKAYAEIIREEMEKLGVHTFLLDITTPKVRDNLLNFDDFEAVLFGFPIYSFRAPRIIRDWLSKLRGGSWSSTCFYQTDIRE
jgi:flavodoxin